MAKILQLKIYLEDIEPKIWRRFLVSDSWTFDELHRIIQEVMGWENYHLYEFDINRIKIGLMDDDVDYDLEDAKKAQIGQYLNKKGQKFSYLYDFGDGWEHKLIIEEITEDKREGERYPCCITGERACPPEDCGGVNGYERFLEVLKTGKDPWNEDVKELKEWLGDWGPEKFNIIKINKEILKIRI